MELKTNQDLNQVDLSNEDTNDNFVSDMLKPQFNNKHNLKFITQQ